MKKFIFIAFAMVSLFTLSGCGDHIPTVEVNNGLGRSFRSISIGKPYEYKDFDVKNTDEGKDLILHFVEGEG